MLYKSLIIIIIIFTITLSGRLIAIFFFTILELLFLQHLSHWHGVHKT